MGSKLSKAVRQRPHGRDDAALHHAPSTSYDNKLHRIEASSQDSNAQLLKGSHPALVDGELSSVAASPLTHEHTSAAISSPQDNDNDAMDIDSPSAAILSELQELPGNVANENPAPLSPARTCLICTDDIDRAKAIRPCKCKNDYCASCLRNLFLSACKDMTLMPPRCCTMIPIHHVRAHLSKEEADLFRSKFEEWSTPKPFYCPVARCSVFISNRFLPQTRTSGKGKQRVDSGIGTPTSPTVSCPACDTKLCVSCRSLAHHGGACEPLEFGLDKKTADLLKKWGYKECPKCGHGLKRMFGCNHMECRCGAHFCYGCMRSQNDCNGGCSDEEEGDLYGEPDSDVDDVEEEQKTDAALPPDSSKSPEAATVSAEPEQSPGRIRNLDGGSGQYWEQQDYDFGDEPTDNYQDRSWDCAHIFSTMKMSLDDSLRVHSSQHTMECMGCWGTVHPEIVKPVRMKRGRKGPRGYRGSARNMLPGRTHRPAETMPYLSPELHMAHSMPSLSSEPMEDVQSTSHSEKTPDLHSNIVTAQEEPNKRRRFSLSFVPASTIVVPPFPHAHRTDQSQLSFPVNPYTTSSFTVPSIPSSPGSNPFSLGHECDSCGMIVCSTCKSDLLASYEARQAQEQAREEEAAAAEAAEDAAQEVAEAEAAEAAAVAAAQAQTSSEKADDVPDHGFSAPSTDAQTQTTFAETWGILPEGAAAEILDMLDRPSSSWRRSEPEEQEQDMMGLASFTDLCTTTEQGTEQGVVST